VNWCIDNEGKYENSSGETIKSIGFGWKMECIVVVCLIITPYRYIPAISQPANQTIGGIWSWFALSMPEVPE
jgi:hypothetical protein